MTKKILIIKTGSALNCLSHLGDFENWIGDGLGVSLPIVTVDVKKQQKFPDCDQLAGILITGSVDMVTDCADWSEKTAKWLKDSLAYKIPTLGICFGHQLLVHALGGKVGKNPNGREVGTVEVYLNEEQAANDSLFAGFPRMMKLHVSHAQCVMELPEQAYTLAKSEKDRYQAFVWHNHIWGVQFHPEFNAEIIAAYVEVQRKLLSEEGQNPDQLMEQCLNTEFGGQILQRFGQIIEREYDGFLENN